jgi:translation initiation factor 5
LWIADNAAASPAVIMDELRVIQAFGSFRPADRVIIYVGAVMSDQLITSNEIVAHKHVLSLWSSSAPLQRHLIAGFEWLCGVKIPSLLKLFPVVLKTLFDEELVEEDVIFAWHTDIMRNEFSADQSLISLDTLEQLRVAAGPFITWLQEAEEEGDDDEEEEEDGEEADENEDDVDVDDI